MSTFRKKDAYGSPMDEVFIWATPRNTQKDNENGASSSCSNNKRKCEDDSGYLSTGSSVSKSSITTPEIVNDICVVNDTVFTPFLKQGTAQSVKKRIFTTSTATTTTVIHNNNNNKSDVKYSNYLLNVVDSYTEYESDTSLYNEPMEISGNGGGGDGGGGSGGGVVPITGLCIINEEEVADTSLGVNEISKKIDVNLEIDSMTPQHPVALMAAVDVSSSSPPPSSQILKKSSTRSPLKKKFTKPRRSLFGYEKVDLLFQFGEKQNYPMIISKIFSYLSDNDLSTVTMVSTTWRKICLKDPKARGRWYKYTQYLKERKENPTWNINSLRRNQPHPLMNRNYSTPLRAKQQKSPPVSPSKFRFHLFQKEARNLKEDEILMECPRCARPSACSPSTLIGECRALACMLKFCTMCRTPAHEHSPCVYLTPLTPTKRIHTSIGSKESKRFLRRL